MLKITCSVVKKRQALLVMWSMLLSVAAIAHDKNATRIKDNRLDYLRPLPTLGFGYSPLTNKVHSLCVSPVVEIPSSYQYQTHAIDLTKQVLDEQIRHDDLQWSSTIAFARRVAQFGDERGQALKNILFTVDVESSGTRFDTTQTIFTTFAKSLLKSNDLIQFYMLCGSHFLTAIGRYSTLAVVLTYKLDRTAEDEVFDRALKTALQRIYEGAEDPYVEKEAQRRQLRIAVEAIGIGYPHTMAPDIYVNTLPELRTTLRGIERDMLSENTGFGVLLEASSWDDYLPFLEILRVAGRDTSFRATALLRKNAAFVSSVLDTMDRNDELTERARGCAKIIHEEYDAYDPETTLFENALNLGNPSYQVNLQTMRNELDWERIEKLEAQRDYFLYGSAAAPSGVFYCFDLLNKRGLQAVDYTTISVCSDVMRERALSVPFISQYCLPRLVRPDGRP